MTNEAYDNTPQSMQPLVDSWCYDLDQAIRTIPNLYMVILKHTRTITSEQRRSLIDHIMRLKTALEPLTCSAAVDDVRCAD